MIYGISLHNVKKVEVLKSQKSILDDGSIYYTGKIIIKMDDQKFLINLFGDNPIEFTQEDKV